MQLIQKIWNKFKARPDEWFFYGFLLTFTLSIRKVLAYYPINGQFNEYTSVYLYLSDIFLALTIVFWLFFVLYNKLSFLSIYKMFHACRAKTKCSTPAARRQNVPRGTFWILAGWNNLDIGWVKQFGFWLAGTILIPLLLVIWSFISISWAENQNLALFQSIKLLGLYLLFIYIIKNVPRGTFLRNSLLIIIFTGIMNSTIGIWQFVVQRSTGIFWLKESLISPEIPSVAKIIFDEERFIRAYGLFPHPNILGGFLLFSILCAWLYHKLFHSTAGRTGTEQLSTQNTQICSTWNNYRHKTHKIVPRGTIYNLILAIQIMALIVTFSKSAILGLILSIVYIIYKFVPRGTNILNSITDFVAQNIKKILLITLLGLTFIFIAKPDTSKWIFQSFEERLLYINVSRGTISDHPILGVGAGQFVSGTQKYTQHKLEMWQFQPVHNVFLLIWSELGAIGLLIFVLFLYGLFHVEHKNATMKQNCSTWNNTSSQIVPRGTSIVSNPGSITFKGALTGLIFIILFDHYLWDIRQGELLLWITFGFLVGTAFPSENLSIDK